MDFTDEFWKRREEEVDSHKASILMELAAEMTARANTLTAQRQGDPNAQLIRQWVKKIREAA